MVASNVQPHIIMVGGAGDASGVPRHICQLASALRTDAQITVISDINQGGFDDLATSGAKHQIIKGLATHRVTNSWRILLKALRTTSADIIWLHAPLPALIARLTMALRLWRPNCPVMFTCHAQPFAKGQPRPIRIASLLLEKTLLALGPHHHIVFLTEAMAARTHRSLGPRLLARHSTHVLPNCANLGPIAHTPQPNTRHLIMTGRASRQKDHERAFRLFATLPNDTRLTLCGPGTNNPAFLKRTHKILSKDAFERVTFVGPVHDVRPYLAAADALLLTSRYEGHPIGILEAFEAGLPIILSRFEGADELLKLHPCGYGLSLDHTADAQGIITLIDRFRAHRDALSNQTRAVWKAHWSPEIFDMNYRTFVRHVIAAA